MLLLKIFFYYSFLLVIFTDEKRHLAAIAY